MSTLADPEVVRRCEERLSRLRPDSPRLWGKMTAPQMVCHLSDAFLGVTGRKPMTDVSNFFTRTAMRYVAMHAPLKWPRGVKTLPEMDQHDKGTPPGDWAQDTDRLRGLIVEFPGISSFKDHPIFGPMTLEEWMTWGYRHVDHHFRQFGV